VRSQAELGNEGNEGIAVAGTGVMFKVFTVLAAVCFVLSLVAHGSTFVGVNLTRQIPRVWWLHILTLGVCFVAFVAGGKLCKKTSERDFLKCARRYSPPWVYHLVAIFFFYMFVNFSIWISNTRERGDFSRINDEPVLRKDGQVRKLTPEEADRYEAANLRGMSGHWMLFSSGAFMVLLAWERSKRVTRSTGNSIASESGAREGDALTKR
jgi:hypothetical protein